VATENDALYIHAGDLVLLVGKDRHDFILRMQPDDEVQTHHGVVPHTAIIGLRWGATILTHLGYA